jgi:hypothetical protein
MFPMLVAAPVVGSIEISSRVVPPPLAALALLYRTPAAGS